MDIDKKLNHILELIERISPIKEYRKNEALAKEFKAVAEDTSLPKVFREFCDNAVVSLLGNPNGPLDTSSQKKLREIFMGLKVTPNVRRETKQSISPAS